MRPVFALQSELAELILDKKKRRESFDNADAKLNGFQDAGHQAKAVEDKLNKAAWFVISAKLSERLDRHRVGVSERRCRRAAQGPGALLLAGLSPDGRPDPHCSVGTPRPQHL